MRGPRGRTRALAPGSADQCGGNAAWSAATASSHGGMPGTPARSSRQCVNWTPATASHQSSSSGSGGCVDLGEEARGDGVGSRGRALPRPGVGDDAGQGDEAGAAEVEATRRDDGVLPVDQRPLDTVVDEVAGAGIAVGDRHRGLRVGVGERRQGGAEIAAEGRWRGRRRGARGGRGRRRGRAPSGRSPPRGPRRGGRERGRADPSPRGWSSAPPRPGRRPGRRRRGARPSHRACPRPGAAAPAPPARSATPAPAVRSPAPRRSARPSPRPPVPSAPGPRSRSDVSSPAAVR